MPSGANAVASTSVAVGSGNSDSEPETKKIRRERKVKKIRRSRKFVAVTGKFLRIACKKGIKKNVEDEDDSDYNPSTDSSTDPDEKVERKYWSAKEDEGEQVNDSLEEEEEEGELDGDSTVYRAVTSSTKKKR